MISALNDETDDNNDEIEKLKKFLEYPHDTGVPPYSLVTWCGVTLRAADARKYGTAAIQTKSFTGTVKDTLVNKVQVGYRFVKEIIKAPMFHSVEKAPIQVFQHGC